MCVSCLRDYCKGYPWVSCNNMSCGDKEASLSGFRANDIPLASNQRGVGLSYDNE